MSKKLLLLLPLIAALLVSFACAKAPETSVPWRDILLRDVATDKSFRISDFKGKVVVLETMGSWDIRTNWGPLSVYFQKLQA